MEDVTYNLNWKEYMLQLLEKKNSDLERMLLEWAKDDKWIQGRLKLMGIEDNEHDLTISNVVEENENLKSWVQQLETEISSPEKHLFLPTKAETLNSSWEERLKNKVKSLKQLNHKL